MRNYADQILYVLSRGRISGLFIQLCRICVVWIQTNKSSETTAGVDVAPRSSAVTKSKTNPKRFRFWNFSDACTSQLTLNCFLSSTDYRVRDYQPIRTSQVKVRPLRLKVRGVMLSVDSSYHMKALVSFWIFSSVIFRAKSTVICRRYQNSNFYWQPITNKTFV